MFERIRQTKEGIWVIDADDHITKWVEDAGRLDHCENIREIAALIPVGGVAIDGGAYIGDHTIAYANQVGPRGRVLAFEPNLAAFRCLAMNLAGYPWVYPVPFALGSIPGMTGFRTDESNPGASRLDVESENNVPVCTLDDVFRMMTDRTPRLDFLKLDLEGCEPYALRGSGFTIGRFLPTIFCEVNRGALARQGSSAEELFATFRTMRYSVKNFDPTQDLSGEQFDVICKPYEA